ncbi:hypothetical protein [Bacillus sp. FJAT-45350]|uniref:hypothetical protein n=1 Tax=Bacillus sp. FJAT-45350 TaxID=2011014 RepID=UPI000BB921E9|nr:hypothetical protein [Bacillus sp. FJAT-45350]
MVTFGTFLTFFSFTFLVLYLDTQLYDVSFVQALHLMLDVHMSLGRVYLYGAVAIGIGVAFVVDYRRKKSQSQ